MIMVHRHFSSVQIIGNIKDEGKAVLMIGNHFSWWDGFFAHYINKKLFDRRFNVMMLEEELKRRMFLNKIGAFSIDKNSRSALESIRFIGELLKDSKNLVVYYPQGEFQSIYDQSIKFEKGIGKVIKRAEPGSFQMIFYAAMIDYGSAKKPKLNFYLSEFKPRKEHGPDEIEKAYIKLYQEAIATQKSTI
jgi:1-acyl-sn-glycerol-3-phosphate acyltransferase